MDAFKVKIVNVRPKKVIGPSDVRFWLDTMPIFDKPSSYRDAPPDWLIQRFMEVR